MQISLFEKPILWKIPTISEQTLADLPSKIATLQSRLQSIFSQHQKVKLANSLAIEDTVLLHELAQMGVNCPSFVLQTGKLNSETLEIAQTLQSHYPQVSFEFYYPNQQDTDDYIKSFGEYAFYDSVELRKRCCFIRKIEPLGRALLDADAWLTGQRQEQSVTRQDLAFAEQDTAHNIAKFNPIFDWTEQDIWAYAEQFNLPFNDLYHQGYPSIGCEPCSKAIRINENIRAGRWWWENQDTKECGLHK